MSSFSDKIDTCPKRNVPALPAFRVVEAACGFASLSMKEAAAGEWSVVDVRCLLDRFFPLLGMLQLRYRYSECTY